MANLEYQILDKTIPESKDPVSRYDILAGSLDGNPEMFEKVNNLEGNEGMLRTYRDISTKATISLEVLRTTRSEFLWLNIVGDKTKLKPTLKRVKSVVPDIFDYDFSKEES